MLQRAQSHAGPDTMYNRTKKLDQISDVKGMAFAWCDAAISAGSASNGLAFDVLDTCTTTHRNMTYTLRRMRLFLPSMHSLCRSRSPLEVQFIHDAACGDRLVLAALFHEGEPSSEAHEAIGSLLLEGSQVRLIDLVPLGRRFFVHDVSGRTRDGHCRELHLISVTEMAIAFEQLAELRARMTYHQRDAEL